MSSMKVSSSTEDKEMEKITKRVDELRRAHIAANTSSFNDLLQSVANCPEAYTFKSRVKNERRIVRKIQRKRSEGQKKLSILDAYPDNKRGDEWSVKKKNAEKLACYNEETIKDIFACRYVALYQSQIPILVKRFLILVEKYNRDNGENIYGEEFEIYTNRPKNDPTSIIDQVLNIVNKSKLFDQNFSVKDVESKTSAYSSVHLVMSRPCSISRLGEEVEENCSFEVQFRDIFEEGWGEIQHSLLYSGKDDLNNEFENVAEQRRIPELHLNTLKIFVDGCSHQASLVKQNLEYIDSIMLPNADNRSVTERTADLAYLKQCMRKLSVSKRVQNLVEKGYKSLLLATAFEGDVERAKPCLREAITSLDAASSGLEKEGKENRGLERRSMGYFVNIESAVARQSLASLLRKNDEERSPVLEQASSILRRVVNGQRDDPVAHWRLGKVLVQLAANKEITAEAISLFESAETLVLKDVETGEDHWLAISIQIDKGFAHFRGAGMAEKSEAIQGLGLAVSACEAACQIWRGQSAGDIELNRTYSMKAESNIIYFLAETKRRAGQLTAEQEERLREVIAGVLAQGDLPLSDGFKSVDNLIHGFWALGEDERAKDFAWKNLQSLRERAESKAGNLLNGNEIFDYLSPGSERDCFQTALNVQNGKDPK